LAGVSARRRGFPRLLRMLSKGPSADFSVQASSDYSEFGFIGNLCFKTFLFIKAILVPSISFLFN